MAETKKKESLEATEAPRTITEIDPEEEYVEVTLFKDGKDYKDDVFVAVNGHGIQIKRGYPVRIKRKYARVIEQGLAQDVKAAELSDCYHSEYAAMMRNI